MRSPKSCRESFLPHLIVASIFVVFMFYGLTAIDTIPNSSLITGNAIAPLSSRPGLTISPGGGIGVTLAASAVDACYLKKKRYDQCCSGACTPSCKEEFGTTSETALCIRTCTSSCVEELNNKFRRREFLKYKPTIWTNHYTPFRTGNF